MLNLKLYEKLRKPPIALLFQLWIQHNTQEPNLRTERVSFSISISQAEIYFAPLTSAYTNDFNVLASNRYLWPVSSIDLQSINLSQYSTVCLPLLIHRFGRHSIQSFISGLIISKNPIDFSTIRCSQRHKTYPWKVNRILILWWSTVYRHSVLGVNY